MGAVYRRSSKSTHNSWGFAVAGFFAPILSLFIGVNPEAVSLAVNQISRCCFWTFVNSGWETLWNHRNGNLIGLLNFFHLAFLHYLQAVRRPADICQSNVDWNVGGMGGVKSHFKKAEEAGTANHSHTSTGPAETNGRKKSSSSALPSTKPTRPHRELIDPQILAKYDILALIGKGSFSRVVRVEHKVTKIRYALKIIDLRKESRFCETELAVLTRLRHPNVIQLVDMLKTPQRCYMASANWLKYQSLYLCLSYVKGDRIGHWRRPFRTDRQQGIPAWDRDCQDPTDALERPWLLASSGSCAQRFEAGKREQSPDAFETNTSVRFLWFSGFLASSGSFWASRLWLKSAH